MNLTWSGHGTIPTSFLRLFIQRAGVDRAAPVVPANAPRATNLDLTGWQWKDASEPASPSFPDRTWLRKPNPMQMDADGDLTADAGYRTTVAVPSTGDYVLHVQGAGDRARSYLLNELAPEAAFFPQVVNRGILGIPALPYPLCAGKH